MPANVFGEGDLPPNTIVWYDGDPSSLPAGWIVCDGNNGTPNILDQFAKSISSASSDPSGGGGNNSITLTENQLPSHGHSADATGSTGDHNHTIYKAKSNDDRSVIAGGSGRTSNPGGNHSHTYTDSTAGSDSSIDNQPEHYEAVPTMKV